MSSAAGALSASTTNAPSTQTRRGRKRVRTDSEETSEREAIQRTDKSVKGAAANSEPHPGGSSKERKRRRKRRRRNSVVENTEEAQIPTLPVHGTSTPKRPRKRSRFAARRAEAMPIAGPSSNPAATGFIWGSMSDIASSPTIKTPSPELALASPILQLSSSKGKGRESAADVTAASTLSTELAELKTQLAAKNELLSNQRTLLSSLQQSIMCQICLDPLHKPYALAPCGHIACQSCLVAWFQAPPADAHPHDVLPVLLRNKTCPHCRAILRERPIEVWVVKDIVNNFFKSGLAEPPMNAPLPKAPTVNASLENISANERTDPWEGIFRKPIVAGAPLFFPDPPPAAALHDLLGMHDAEDGGIYRCVDCGHEIWDGVCSACAREYPAHRHHHLGWDDTHSEADRDEDEPGLMGVWQDGMLFGRGRAPWDLGAGVHDGEDEDESTDVDGGDDDDVGDGRFGFVPMLRGRFYGEPDALTVGEAGEEDVEGEEDDDEDGYESSFIDDDEGAQGTASAEMPAYRAFHDAFAASDAGWSASGEEDSLTEDEGADGEAPSGDGDGEDADDDGMDDMPPVAVRRHRLVVRSDDEEEENEEDGLSEEGEGDSGGGLAAAVAVRERLLYGDDGSISRNYVRSSSPIHLHSDVDSAVDEDSHSVFAHPSEDVPGIWGAEHTEDDGAGWGDDAEDDEDEESVYAYDEAESTYGDGEPASGDECEYGDAVW